MSEINSGLVAKESPEDRGDDSLGRPEAILTGLSTVAMVGAYFSELAGKHDAANTLAGISALSFGAIVLRVIKHQPTEYSAGSLNRLH